jgi:hypothetical protein
MDNRPRLNNPRTEKPSRGTKHIHPKTSVKLRQSGYEHEAIHKFRGLSRGVAIRSRTAQNQVTAQSFYR